MNPLCRCSEMFRTIMSPETLQRHATTTHGTRAGGRYGPLLGMDSKGTIPPLCSPSTQVPPLRQQPPSEVARECPSHLTGRSFPPPKEPPQPPPGPAPPGWGSSSLSVPLGRDACVQTDATGQSPAPPQDYMLSQRIMETRAEGLRATEPPRDASAGPLAHDGARETEPQEAREAAERSAAAALAAQEEAALWRAKATEAQAALKANEEATASVRANAAHAIEQLNTSSDFIASQREQAKEPILSPFPYSSS